MQAHLKRIAIHEQGAFGVLLVDDAPLCLTLEHTYPDGPRGTQFTKIAPGQYHLQRTWYHRGRYNTWQVIGPGIDPERRILLHKGNTEDDSDGCILIGSAFGRVPPGKLGVTSSTEAFIRLMSTTNGLDQLSLLITHC